MYISRLALDHYRSWEHCVLDFKPGINILQGANGLGKTNIVEAIEVLSTGSSHRASSSLPLIEKGCTSATIRANVEDGETQHTYEATIVARGANRARIDGGKSQYMRDLIGRTPSVSFTPEDQRLVAGDPATRRNFINQAASLLLPHYAQTLQQFTHVAKQRTALLKQLGDGTNLDPQYGQQAVLSGLEIWTGQFIDLGMQLTRDRNNVISRLEEPFARIYASLAGDDERAALAYEPSFDEVMLFDDPAAEIILDFAMRQDQVLITVAAASDIPRMDAGRFHADAHVIDVAALRRQSQDGQHDDLTAMMAQLVAGRESATQSSAAQQSVNRQEQR